eukprot:COSAG02_NODE_9003_length_2364_cov_1.188962_1_plen_759_part_10
MFITMQQLCEDTPQDFKNVPNLKKLVKIKSTLDTVIQRCRQQPEDWPIDLPKPYDDRSPCSITPSSSVRHAISDEDFAAFQAEIEGLDKSEQGEFLKRVLRRGKRKLRRCKIVVLGSGGVGKTSLVKRLRREGFDPRQASTCGIDSYLIEALSWNPRGDGEMDEKQALLRGIASELSQPDYDDVGVHGKESTNESPVEGFTGTPTSLSRSWKRESSNQLSETDPGFTHGGHADGDNAGAWGGTRDAEVMTHDSIDAALAQASGADDDLKMLADETTDEQVQLLKQAIELMTSGTNLDDEDPPIAVVLDFAGQRMYYTQHHCELSAELTVYVVAWSLDHDPKELLGGEDEHAHMSHLENIMYWMNSIHGQAPDARILCVGTKSDLVDDEIRKARIAEVERSFEGSAFENQLVGSCICTSSRHEVDPGVSEVRDIVASMMRPFVEETRTGIQGYGQEVPLGWRDFLRRVQRLSVAGTKRLSLDGARSIALSQCEIGKSDEGNTDRELLLMLRTFTALGLLKHAQNSHSQHSIVVLDLQWMVDLMSELLCRRSIEKHHRDSAWMKVQWRRLLRTGRLERKVLPELWPNLNTGERDAMLQYAIDNRLCCELPAECGEPDLFVVPSLLPSCPEDGCWVPNATDNEFRYTFIHQDGEWGESVGFLPESLFFKLTTCLLTDVENVKDAFRHLYRDRAVIDAREGHYMVQLVPASTTTDKPALRVVVRHVTMPRGVPIVDRIDDCLTSVVSVFGVKFRKEVDLPTTN